MSESDKSANEHKIQRRLKFLGTIICFHDPSRKKQPQQQNEALEPTGS